MEVYPIGNLLQSDGTDYHSSIRPIGFVSVHGVKANGEDVVHAGEYDRLTLFAFLATTLRDHELDSQHLITLVTEGSATSGFSIGRRVYLPEDLQETILNVVQA